jgi:hypothetical protein
MNSTVAYRQFPLREPEQSAIGGGQKVIAQQTIDVAVTECRGMPENSNKAIVQFRRDSSFLAWTCPVTVEIFSAEIAGVGRRTAIPE